MKRIVRLTESDLHRIVRRVIKENEEEWVSQSQEMEGESDFSKMDKLEGNTDFQSLVDFFEENPDIAQDIQNAMGGSMNEGQKYYDYSDSRGKKEITRNEYLKRKLINYGVWGTLGGIVGYMMGTMSGDEVLQAALLMAGLGGTIGAELSGQVGRERVEESNKKESHKDLDRIEDNMKKIVRLTESDLHRIVRRVIMESSEEKEESEGSETKVAKPECCTSCNCWADCGGETYWNGKSGRPKITVDKSDTYFSVSYDGPSTGYLIKHGKCGSGDSIHQLCNVLTYEINKYLKGKKLKPDINNIDFEKEGNEFTIGVPLESSEKSYKLERRGRWNGGEAGKQDVIDAYKDKAGYEGPVRYSAGGVIEFFVTFYE